MTYSPPVPLLLTEPPPGMKLIKAAAASQSERAFRGVISWQMTEATVNNSKHSPCFRHEDNSFNHLYGALTLVSFYYKTGIFQTAPDQVLVFSK